ncbi:MAG: phosphate ABC transporter substrate-binding protein PstS [Bacillota bacterium]
MLLVLLAVSCKNSGSTKDGANSGNTIVLNGAGATFPYPLYSKWFDEYYKINSKIQINYQSIGSGGGIKQITARTVDFGASDAPMKEEELEMAPGELLHIPTVLGAVVVTYNLQGVESGLKLTPEVLVSILLGDIKKWNDSKITALNPGVNLPAQDIVVVYRSDGSGTTNIFTDYLAKVSQDWETKVGHGKAVSWPVGIGAKGNEGVAGQIKQTPGSIGYVELAYTVQNKLPFVALKNKSGKFVTPSFESTTAAAEGAATSMPEDLRVSITDAPGENAYPIAGFTYLLVYKQQDDQVKGETLVQFLDWAIHDGQSYAKDLYYAPLPESVVQKAGEKIQSISK